MANQNLGTFCLERILTNVLVPDYNLVQLQEHDMPDGRPSFQIDIEVRRYVRENYNSDVAYGFLRPASVNPNSVHPIASRATLVNVLRASSFQVPTKGSGQFMRAEKRLADQGRRLQDMCVDFYGHLTRLRNVVRRDMNYECLGFMNPFLTPLPTVQGAGSILFTATVVFAHPVPLDNELPPELNDFAIPLVDPEVD